MKIDLHCHTKKTKSGDPQTRNVTPELFAEKISKANIEIVAITNHNEFDYSQYETLSNIVSEYCLVWPGIELDVKDDIIEDQKGHLIVIANPKNAKEFSEGVKSLTKDSTPDNFITTLPEIYSLLDKYDVIYIPHFNKDPHLSETCINNFDAMLTDKSRLFKETSNYRSLGVYSNFDYSVIIGSDVKNWNEYEKCKSSNIRLKITTFEQFCLLAKKDKQIIDTLLKEKRKNYIDVSPAKKVSISIPIYNDINVIFGQKGTGKTEILQSLNDYYTKTGIKSELYIGNERDEIFKKLLNCAGLQQEVSKFDLSSNLSHSFKTIYEWNDEMPTAFTSYIDWWTTKGNNENKKRMKITDSLRLEKPDTDDAIDDDYSNAITFLNSVFFKINFDKYIDSDKKENLFKLIEELIGKISCSKLDAWKEECAIELSNFTIEKIKTIADKCSNTKSKPSSTGFSNFAEKRLIVYNVASLILEALKQESVKELTYLGNLEEKGDIYIQTHYRFLCNESTGNEYNGKLRKLQKFHEKLISISQNFTQEDLTDQILEYREMYDVDGIKQLEDFIGISKQVVLKNGEMYKPSNGEQGILLMQKMLASDADVFILDEPELGMGNSYITANILPKLTDLAKQMKTVIVATHNANIAVSTLPYCSIFRTHKDGQYDTYIGNPFSDELVNIHNENDVKNWTTESMHTLEGGPDAFYGRKDIYESGRK